MIKINLKELLNYQKKFDSFVYIKNKVIYKDIKNKLHLAMMAELMELCNEIRCFNYWSDKKRTSDECVLSEFADVMSFALSEGIEKYNLIEVEDIEIKDCKKTDNNEELTDKFLVLIHLYNDISCQKSMLNFISNLFELGYMLGYDIHTITNAYHKKCDLVKVMQDKRNVQ